MKARKLIIPLIFSFCILSLAGCKGDGKLPEISKPGQSNPSDPPTPPTTPEGAIVVDISSSLPDVDYKRGYIIDAAVNRGRNQDLIDYLTKSKNLGMTIAAMPKDLNQFDQNYTGDAFFRSYRSRGNAGSGFLGANGEQEEFSGTKGGKIDVRINSLYLAACRKAVEYDIQLIVQCSGVPVEGQNDGSVKQLFDLDPTRSFHRSARYYPWPAPAERDTVGGTIFTYMKMLKDELGVSDIIFAGNQEPSHTAGYPGGTQTTTGTNNNISNYPLVWHPTANRLRAAGMLSGCSQLNQVSSEYDRSLNSISTNSVPFDFYTIQNYKGINNRKVFTDAKAALEKYGYTTHKRILFNRYDSDDNSGMINANRFGTSNGVISILDCELELFDFAELLYGYCFFTAVKDFEMMDSTFKFLNNAPKSRKKLLNLPPDVKGFVMLDDKKMSMGLWNTSQSVSTDYLTIDHGNLPSFVKADIYSLNNETISDQNSLWSSFYGKIDKFILRPREIYYISLSK